MRLLQGIKTYNFFNFVRKIICENVNQLIVSTDYFIGIRMCFPYDLWQKKLEGEFGELIIYSVRNGVVDTEPFINSDKAISKIQT